MKFLMALVGFVAGAIVGLFIAGVFGDALFGWHDNIGPELRFAFLSGLIGAPIGVFLQLAREQRKNDKRGEGR